MTSNADGNEVSTPYDDEYAEPEGEFDDTVDSLETFNKNLKIPTVKIHSRSRVVRLEFIVFFSCLVYYVCLCIFSVFLSL
ncbi:hypothetical protein Hanom_Chr11g01016921 [Helianthus anomalus]